MAVHGNIWFVAPFEEIVETLVPKSDRLTDLISIGVLASSVSRDLVDEVVEETGRRERRRRLLPADVTVYFTMAMCLFYEDDYEEVMRKLVGALRSVKSWRDDWRVPSTAAISKARARLGEAPLRRLFQRVAAPVAGRGTKGAWLGRRRLMAVDGFGAEVPDTPENAEEFGRRKGPEKSGAFPRVTVAALVECGTHAVVAAAFGGAYADERVLAEDVFGYLEDDMLLTADRNFLSYSAWQRVVATGADVLWRVRSDIVLPVVRALPDGSYLSVRFRPDVKKKRTGEVLAAARRGEPLPDEEAVWVRVVEYDVPNRDGDGHGELICLVTSILDHTDVTAAELAAAYHERWEAESTYGEVKTRMKGPARVLRSRSPEMVRQELWALLLTHHAVRRVMTAAAEEADVDPDRLSFLRSLRVVRRQVVDQAAFSP